MKNNIENFGFVSLEELAEAEYNMEYNPYDTTGSGYIEDDFTDKIRDSYKMARDYHKLMENIDFNQ